MKAACIILTIIIFVAIMAVCVMVKFATDITVEERKREFAPSTGLHQVAKSITVMASNDNKSQSIAERFPYVAAIARNSSKSWIFSCFASVVLVRWVVTSAHCRKKDAIHRVLLLSDFANNNSRTFPILFWRIHEKFHQNTSFPNFDIAIAKLNIDDYHFVIKPSTFDNRLEVECEASIWKTVATMDRHIYLINDFSVMKTKIVSPSKCYETYGVLVDESMVCVDMSQYDDCFVHEFGPIFHGDKLVGVLAVKPRDCEVKHAIFTNVSFYATWILKLTHTNFYR